MVIAVAAAAGGPSWTDIMTAFGTVGAVVVAVGIALWTERRSGQQIRAEHDRGDRLLGQQREHERAALNEERSRAKAELEEERSYSRAQIEEERQLAREREQLVEAYRVQVVPAYMTADQPTGRFGDPDVSVLQLAVMVVKVTSKARCK